MKLANGFDKMCKGNIPEGEAFIAQRKASHHHFWIEGVFAIIFRYKTITDGQVGRQRIVEKIEKTVYWKIQLSRQPSCLSNGFQWQSRMARAYPRKKWKG